jgi:putative oxidoreductase
MVTTLDARLAGYHSPVLSVFRIIFGLLYMMHGSQKLFDWPIAAPAPIETGSFPFWWAGLIEFVLGILITVGLFTRIAAFVASGEMAFAYFYQHWPILKGDASAPFWPIANGGELAVMFCFAFLLLATTGAGAWAADTRRRVPMARTGATAGPVVTGRAAPRARAGLLSRFRRR